MGFLKSVPAVFGKRAIIALAVFAFVCCVVSAAALAKTSPLNSIVIFSLSLPGLWYVSRQNIYLRLAGIALLMPGVVVCFA